MLSAEGCLARRQRLWDRLPDSCDVVLINSPEHLSYLAGYWPSGFTFRTNEAGAALILTRSHATLVGDNLLRPFLDSSLAIEVVAPVWYDGTRAALPRREHLARAVAAQLGTMRPRELGVERALAPVMMVGETSPSRLVDVSSHLLAMRRAKDPDEVNTLRRAIAIAGQAMNRASSLVREGASELDVFSGIEHACHEFHGGPISIYGDFARGDRAKGPDTLPRRDLLRAGDLLILDFSVVVQGYRGDFASTFCVGPPSPEQRKVFDACMAALSEGEAWLKPGTPCRELDRVLRARLRSAGYAADRPGHLGHGIGLSHPEAPFFVRESDEVLAVGDVVTLEPSLFPGHAVAGFDGGVRIEHKNRITADGCERLSHHRLGFGDTRQPG